MSQTKQKESHAWPGAPKLIAVCFVLCRGEKFHHRALRGPPAVNPKDMIPYLVEMGQFLC